MSIISLALERYCKKRKRLVDVEEEGSMDGRRLCVIRTASTDVPVQYMYSQYGRANTDAPVVMHFMYDIVSVDRFDPSIDQSYIQLSNKRINRASGIDIVKKSLVSTDMKHSQGFNWGLRPILLNFMGFNLTGNPPSYI